MLPDASVSANQLLDGFALAVPEIEISLDSSKAAGPNVSLQLPNTSALKAGPVNEHDTHPMKTLSKYILRS